RTRPAPGAGWGGAGSTSRNGLVSIGAAASRTCAFTRLPPPAALSPFPTHRARICDNGSRGGGSLRDERGPALDCRAARLAGADELEGDETPAAVPVALRGLAGARERVAGPDLLPKLGAEAAHVGGAEPVGRVRGEDAGLEHPDREHRREPRAFGVLLVVVDRVEVA